ncbi:apolipoprotein C-II [Echinops telfairi]|uniref:Apolipoprotein C-II n=1 Tax=Echinops telfairi TaxID=9371 RepID=A0ABM0IY22_ECHTE|nr:apolipoprotein C-II [Echinops telfairi]
MATRYLLVFFLVLLVLGLEVRGASLLQADEPGSPALLSQVQDSIYRYWDSAKTAAQGLYSKTYLPSLDEKIRGLYSQSTAAMTTYAGIMTDQLLALLKGEQ